MILDAGSQFTRFFTKPSKRTTVSSRNMLDASLASSSLALLHRSVSSAEDGGPAGIGRPSEARDSEFPAGPGQQSDFRN